MIALPSDEILMKHASGVLDPALRLLVDRHGDLHPATRARIARFRELGGRLLAAEAGAEMTAGSLDRALARIGGAAPPPPPPDGWPPFEAMAWRWAGPGRSIASVPVAGSRMKAYALRIAPGRAMLRHGHAAGEWTLIVQGGYRDESGEYGVGAFIEEDEETDHRPVATGDVECICLSVMSGPLAASGVIGMAARWLMR